MGMFDASDASSPEPGAGELLRTMAADESEQRMLAFLDELDELIEEDREREREEGLDPSVAALLESITGADDAPLEFRSLNRRVAEGVTSWEEFWVAPEETPGGHRLVNVAMKAAGAELADAMRRFDDRPPPTHGGVLGR